MIMQCHFFDPYSIPSLFKSCPYIEAIEITVDSANDAEHNESLCGTYSDRELCNDHDTLQKHFLKLRHMILKLKQVEAVQPVQVQEMVSEAQSVAHFYIWNASP